MFKKLLTNLPFNPSLISEVGFYAQRLKAENSVRRMGFAFMTLSLLVQGLAVMVPSQPTFASDPNDIFRGGFRDQAHMVNSCNENAQNFKKILEYFDVTCTDLFFGEQRRIKYNENDGKMYSMGREPLGKPGERPLTIPGVDTFFVRPMTSFGSTCFNDGAGCQAVVTKRPDGTPFWVLLACGNPVMFGPPTPPVPDPEPDPEPDPDPKPERYVGCNALIMNVPNGSTVPLDAFIRIRGRASGRNLGPDAKVDMYYEYVNASNGDVISRAESKNVLFNSDRTLALDPSTKQFEVKEPGRFIFRLAVKYDNSTKNAVGNNRGACAKEVLVEVTKPCEEAENTEDLIACIEQSKVASNETQGLENANGTVAKPGDIILYGLSIKNNSTDTVIPQFVVKEHMSDVLQYAEVVDLFGGTMDAQNVVTWPAVDIQPGETITKQIKVRVKDPIPQTPTSGNNPGSFDLTMTNVYGDTVNIELEGEIVKEIERVNTELPNTGPGETLAVVFAGTTIVGYFFARSRLMSRELEIVKNEYSTGGAQ